MLPSLCSMNFVLRIHFDFKPCCGVRKKVLGRKTCHHSNVPLYLSMAASHRIATLALAVAVCLSETSAFSLAPLLPRPANLRSSAVRPLSMQLERPKPDLGLAKFFVEDNEQAADVFAFLQATDYRKEREGLLMGDVIADRIIRQGGFHRICGDG